MGPNAIVQGALESIIEDCPDSFFEDTVATIKVIQKPLEADISLMYSKCTRKSLVLLSLMLILLLFSYSIPSQNVNLSSGKRDICIWYPDEGSRSSTHQTIWSHVYNGKWFYTRNSIQTKKERKMTCSILLNLFFSSPCHDHLECSSLVYSIGLLCWCLFSFPFVLTWTQWNKRLGLTWTNFQASHLTCSWSRDWWLRNPSFVFRANVLIIPTSWGLSWRSLKNLPSKPVRGWPSSLRDITFWTRTTTTTGKSLTQEYLISIPRSSLKRESLSICLQWQVLDCIRQHEIIN